MVLSHTEFSVAFVPDQRHAAATMQRKGFLYGFTVSIPSRACRLLQQTCLELRHPRFQIWHLQPPCHFACFIRVVELLEKNAAVTCTTECHYCCCKEVKFMLSLYAQIFFTHIIFVVVVTLLSVYCFTIVCTSAELLMIAFASINLHHCFCGICN